MSEERQYLADLCTHAKTLVKAYSDNGIEIDGRIYSPAFLYSYLDDFKQQPDKLIRCVLYEHRNGARYCTTAEKWEQIAKSPEPPQPQPVTAPDILAEAAAIMAQRGEGYDKNQERSMAKIVATFNTLTGLNLDESHGWIFMMILKLVRLMTSTKPHADSGVDLVAYASLLAECELSKVRNVDEFIETVESYKEKLNRIKSIVDARDNSD